MKKICYISLGSNLNNPIVQIQKTIGAIKNLPDTKFIQASSFYQTEPISDIPQEDYINAVVKIETTLLPLQLLNELNAIEKTQGRIRDLTKNAPRIIDCDILLYDREIIDDTQLQIPHPRMHERLFVLIPLAEIDPDLILPNGKSIQNLIVSCHQQVVVQL